jgi:hypothetical protein
MDSRMTNAITEIDLEDFAPFTFDAFYSSKKQAWGVRFLLCGDVTTIHFGPDLLALVAKYAPGAPLKIFREVLVNA